jgi:predicted transcriptional regulator
MARVNVFLPDDLLQALDAEAAAGRVKRSAFVQTALRNFLESRRKAREDAELRRGMDGACDTMDGLAAKLGEWDPVEAIRENRDRRFALAEPRARRSAKRRRR